MQNMPPKTTSLQAAQAYQLIIFTVVCRAIVKWALNHASFAAELLEAWCYAISVLSEHVV